MYLKSIEIRGFKSFADKTLLHFNDGITAVVGPNGSGKSNISDAVRWVLGEQKVKSLRGGKMEDVIFSGTDFRKPLGCAEVTLLMDNSSKKLPMPYSEVSVTRKLYRSGESEYLINNTNCRLRDVHELFMDTGIGKEGYSLIGQGKIEAILSGKMDDRRALLEEAAGIVKYKSRKEESAKKLEHTDQNLLRVHDILNTYEERIGPLKREKEKAEKFLVLSEEHKGILISLLLIDLEEAEKEIEGLEERHENVLSSYKTAEKDRDEASNKRDELEAHMEEKSKEENDLKESFYGKRETHEKNIHEIKLLTQIINDRGHLFARNEKSLEIIKSRTEEEKQQIEIMEKELLGAGEGLNRVQEQLKVMRKAQETLQISLKLSQDAQKGIRDEEEDTELKVLNLKDQIQSQYQHRDKISGQIENIKSMLLSYGASLTLNEKAGLDTQAELESLKMKMQKEEAIRLGLHEETNVFVQELAQFERHLKTMDYDIRGKESQKNLLENLEKHYEGYTRSVKSLMTYLEKTNHKLKDEIHLVGEVIKPKVGFELALEVALGSQVNNVITPTDRDAKGLIELLRKNSYGRATFYPLNVMKGYSIRRPSLQKGKLLGNLFDLVEFDPLYENIASSLLGRIFVAKNMDEALVAAKEMGFSSRIVTLEGDMVNAGGSLTGGSIYKKSSGIFSRKKDLETLKEELILLLKKREEDEEKKKTLEEKLNLKKKDMRESTYVLNQDQMDFAKLTERREGFNNDLLRVKAIIKDAHEQLERKNAEQESLDETIKEIEQKILALSNQKAKNKDFLSELKEKRTQEFAQSEELQNQIMEESVKEARFLQSHESKVDTLEKSKNNLVSLSQQEEELMEENKDLQEEISGSEVKIKTLTSEQVQLKESLKTMEDGIDQFTMEEVRNRSKLKEVTAYVRTLEEEYHRLDKDLFKVQETLEQVKMKKEGFLRKLNEDLHLTVAEAKEERSILEDVGIARQRQFELKKKITALGNVNVAAIEEYEEVKEHQEFLSSQRDDLEKAKGELKELILDMTLRMRTMFSENFKVMNENFNDTFRSLFQGGHAELILGEGDVLEAPIEISVQPPGKKLQNITLMSGGEKVLSAIALTFAILRMKPTPFCILDEIEAALDDANVYRFAEFLTEFAKDTQFILITHRKGTMEASDALYGVTMEEKGISKIVSMDLSEVRRTTNG